MEVEVTGAGTWKFKSSEDGLIELHRRHNFSEPQPTVDAMGNYWVFGIAEILDGEVSYRCKEEVFRTDSRYGIFLPKWSLVYGAVNCKEQFIQCVVSNQELPHFVPTNAVVFEPLANREFPTSTQEVADYLATCRILKSVEYNAQPSGAAQRIKCALDQNFRGNRSLAELARKMKMSSTVFGREFRKNFALTPISYRNHMRIVAGSFELLKGKMVTDVFQEIGFNDLSRFNKQFKRIVGASPKKFSPVKKSRKTPSFK